MTLPEEPEFQKKDISKKQFWTAQKEMTKVTQTLEVSKLQSFNILAYQLWITYTKTLWTVYELVLIKWLPSEIHNA